MFRFVVSLSLLLFCNPMLLRGQEEVPSVVDSRFVLDETGEIISGPGYGNSGQRDGLYATEGAYPDDVAQNEDPSWWHSFSGTPLGGRLRGNDATLVSPTQGTRADSKLPGGIREGMFQKFFVSATWLPGSGKKSFGFTQLDLSTSFAFPLFKEDSRFLVTPTFSAWFTEWERESESFSKNLFSASCEFRLIRPLTSHYTLEVAANPGWWSDFKSGSSDGFRIPAHAGLIWNYNPRTKLLLGCAYLDRADYDWLPFGGLIWEPDNELEMRFELLFPNPKIAKRIRWWGSAVGNEKSDWLYIGGELAGSNWTFQTHDRFTNSEIDSTLSYRDYRAFLGFERKSSGGINFALELGGVFNRKFRSTHTLNQDVSLDSDFFLRLKAMY